MRPLPLFLTALLFLLISVPLFSQTVAAPEKVQLMVEYVGEEVHYDPMEDQSDLSNDEIQLTLLVHLPPAQVYSKLYVKAGTSQGGDDICELSFNADGTNLPVGTTCLLEGDMVKLTLGSYSGKQAVYAEVRLEDALGNRSSASTVSF